jgi:hypothetical protein
MAMSLRAVPGGRLTYSSGFEVAWTGICTSTPAG